MVLKYGKDSTVPPPGVRCVQLFFSSQLSFAVFMDIPTVLPRMLLFPICGRGEELYLPSPAFFCLTPPPAFLQDFESALFVLNRLAGSSVLCFSGRGPCFPPSSYPFLFIILLYFQVPTPCILEVMKYLGPTRSSPDSLLPVFFDRDDSAFVRCPLSVLHGFVVWRQAASPPPRFPARLAWPAFSSSIPHFSGPFLVLADTLHAVLPNTLPCFPI